MNFLFLIAQAPVPSPELPGGSGIGDLFSGSAGMEIPLLLGVAIFVALIFAFWATFIRKPKKGYLAGGDSESSRSRKSRSSRSKSDSSRDREYSADGEDTDSEEGSGERKRRRKRRRPHRKRMPSLAEAGGLPPVKDVWLEAESKNSSMDSESSQAS